MSWAGKRNGELLSLAAGRFDAFITVDQNMLKQHDLSQYDIAVIVLVARSNRLADLQPLIPQLLAALTTTKSGEAVEIS
jgi:hypothetical protein